MENEQKETAGCSSGGCGAAGSAGIQAKLQDQVIESSLSKIRHRLMVMSGKGGVGKSSVAAHLAVGLSNRDLQVGLMDVDLHGPSIAKIMGLKGLLEVYQNKFAVPKAFNEHLKVVSMQSLMRNSDDAVIWRGPAKTGVIRQFVGDVKWDELDFLIIDAPPGTGDEPLSVAQTIPDAKALIITTPQDVALSDVRKSINFCKTVNLEILGLIENMGPFPCPCCGETIEIFKSGGGEKTAREMGIPFLGRLPFDPQVVSACDKGAPLLQGAQQSEFATALEDIIVKVLNKLE
jgi:Mrp family chromosome partitioning ATPase